MNKYVAALIGTLLWVAGTYCVLFRNWYMPGVVLVTGGVALLELFYYRVKDKR